VGAGREIVRDRGVDVGSKGMNAPVRFQLILRRNRKTIEPHDPEAQPAPHACVHRELPEELAIPGIVAMASARWAFQLRSETDRRSPKTDESGATARCSSTENRAGLGEPVPDIPDGLLEALAGLPPELFQVPVVVR